VIGSSGRNRRHAEPVINRRPIPPRRIGLGGHFHTVISKPALEPTPAAPPAVRRPPKSAARSDRKTASCALPGYEPILHSGVPAPACAAGAGLHREAERAGGWTRAVGWRKSSLFARLGSVPARLERAALPGPVLAGSHEADPLRRAGLPGRDRDRTTARGGSSRGLLAKAPEYRPRDAGEAKHALAGRPADPPRSDLRDRQGGDAHGHHLNRSALLAGIRAGVHDPR
jgi:hypothetical protein